MRVSAQRPGTGEQPFGGGWREAQAGVARRTPRQGVEQRGSLRDQGVLQGPEPRLEVSQAGPGWA